MSLQGTGTVILAIVMIVLALAITFGLLSLGVWLVSLSGLFAFKWSYVFIAWGVMILLKLLLK